MKKNFFTKVLLVNVLFVLTLNGWAQETESADSLVVKEPAIDSLAWMETKIRNSCAGVEEESLCLEWMRTHSALQWKTLDSLFCKNRESIDACKLYLDSIPREKRGPYLRTLESEGLLNFTRTVESDTVYEKTLTTGECFRDLEEMTNRTMRMIAESDAGDSMHFDFGNCAFDGSDSAKHDCESLMNAFAQARKEECVTSVVTKMVREKFEKVEQVHLFDRQIDALWSGLWNLDWYKRDTSWNRDMEFLGKMGLSYSEEYLRTQIRDAFQNTNDVWNFLLLNACSVYPTIDDGYEKMQYFRLFDCDSILKNHQLSCDGSVLEKEVPRTMNGQQPVKVICDLKEHRWREMNEEERRFGLCSAKNFGEEKKTPTGIFICDQGWKKLTEADTWDRDFSSGFAAGKFRPKREYFQDSRDGKVYRIVKVGTQTWMAMNLNYATLWGSRCGNGKDINCTAYGRLYNQEAAQKVCPAGWHLPTSADWENLYAALQNQVPANQKNKLISAGGFVWQPAPKKEAMVYWIPDVTAERMTARVKQTGISWDAESGKFPYHPVRCVLDE